MIDKFEIIRAAKLLGLPLSTVEKDYVLGWVLMGIQMHPEAQEKWIFKGGTCLKKCFFDNYRFSEDLDFIQSIYIKIPMEPFQLRASSLTLAP